MKSKLYIGGITNGPENKIKDLIDNCVSYADGLVFAVDDRQTDGTFDLLNENKKDGQIIKVKFNNAHDWSANAWLHCGVIKFGDWVLILDSSDRINPIFSKQLKENIEHWNQNGIYSIYLDRPFLFRFTGHQFFNNTPHWGLSGVFSPSVNLSQINGYKKESYLFNTRQIDASGIEHPIKYFIEYKRSNQSELLYSQFGQDAFHFHEISRIKFQIWVESVLQIPCTVDSLVNYIKNGIDNKNLPKEMIDFIEQEVNMQDLVRYYILKHNLMSEISVNRFNWSFKKFYFDGVEHQGKFDGYVGLFNQYRIEQNKSME